MSTTLETLVNRLACNASSRVGTLDVISDEQVEFFQGITGRIEGALFDGPPSADTYVSSVANISSIRLYIHKNGPDGTLLLYKETVDVVASSYAAWVAGTGEQFAFNLDKTDTSQVLPSDGTLRIYFAIVVLTTDLGADIQPLTYVAAFGYGEIASVGIFSLVPEPDAPFIAVYALPDGTVQNPVLDFSDVTVTGLDVSGVVITSIAIVDEDLPASRSFIRLTNTDAMNYSLDAGSVKGIEIDIRGGGTGSTRKLTGVYSHVLINSTTIGTNSGADAVFAWSDSNAYNASLQRSVVAAVTSDAVTARAIGLLSQIDQNGAGSMTTAQGIYVDMIAGNSVLPNVVTTLNDPTGIFVTMRKKGSATLSGIAKGLALEAWSGTPTTSYGIFIDSTIAIGVTPWTFYSLCTAPSLFSGPLSATMLVTPATGFVAGAPTTGEGTVCMFNNANTGTPGASITTTGIFHVLAYWNGSAWIVA